jgi:hypothetical protein
MKGATLFRVLMLFETVRNISASNCKCLDDETNCNGATILAKIKNCAKGIIYHNYTGLIQGVDLETNSILKINISFHPTRVERRLVPLPQTDLLHLNVFLDKEEEEERNIQLHFAYHNTTNHRISMWSNRSDSNNNAYLRQFTEASYDEDVKLEVIVITNDRNITVHETIFGTETVLEAADPLFRKFYLYNQLPEAVTFDLIVYNKNYTGDMPLIEKRDEEDEMLNAVQGRRHICLRSLKSYMYTGRVFL